MSDPTPGRAVLATYGGHDSRECGHEAPPKKLRRNVRLEVRTAAGPQTLKLMMDARLAWLLTEGMDLPVLLDDAGRVVELDVVALAAELEGEQVHADAAYRDQSRVLYDVPSRRELGQLKEFGGDLRNALRGLRDTWRGR